MFRLHLIRLLLVSSNLVASNPCFVYRQTFLSKKCSEMKITLTLINKMHSNLTVENQPNNCSELSIRKAYCKWLCQG